jgi:hypothetical protein
MEGSGLSGANEPAVSTELYASSRQQTKSPIYRALYGRYWARTSDPQLVEPVQLVLAFRAD